MNATPVTVAGKAGRRLVLHFDLNKTIIMKDPSMNLHNSTLTVRFLKLIIAQAANILAGLVWGKMASKKPGEELQWTFVTDLLSETKPQIEGADDLISYK